MCKIFVLPLEAKPHRLGEARYGYAIANQKLPAIGNGMLLERIGKVLLYIGGGLGGITVVKTDGQNSIVLTGNKIRLVHDLNDTKQEWLTNRRAMIVDEGNDGWPVDYVAQVDRITGGIQKAQVEWNDFTESLFDPYPYFGRRIGLHNGRLTVCDKTCHNGQDSNG